LRPPQAGSIFEPVSATSVAHSIITATRLTAHSGVR